MSPSSSPVLHSRRPRRPSRPSRGRNRPLERVAISTVVRSALVVTAVWLIATGTYFAFSGDVLTRLIGRQQNTTYEDHIAELRAQIDRIESSKFLDQTHRAAAATGEVRTTHLGAHRRLVRDRHNQAGAHRSDRGNACRKTDARVADQ